MRKQLYSLSDEDKALLPKWRDEVIAAVNSTETMSESDKQKAEKALYEIYEGAKLGKPRIIYVKSPFAARFAAGFYAALLWKKAGKNMNAAAAAAVAAADVADAADAAAGAAAADVAVAAADAGAAAADVAAADAAAGAAAADVAVAADADAAAAADAYKSTNDGDCSYLYGSISSRVNASIKLGVGKLGLEIVRQSYWRFSWRWRLVRRVTFTGFFRRTKMAVDLTAIEKYENLLFSSGLVAFTKGAAFVSDRPLEVHKDAQGRLHNLHGLAAKWRDGSGVYRVHGNSVARRIVDMPVDQITKQTILTEKNADYRRYLVERIGINKAIELLGAEVVDTYESKVGGKYELLMIDYDDSGSLRPYLKMTNPSVGEAHIEGVGPDVKTVKEAIMFRNKLKTFVEPQFLS